MMSQARPPTPDAARPKHRGGLARQALEFLVVLSLCILLFRSFVAEAYVVPSGSMAPTLIGNHREIECPNCAFRFALGLDEEGRAGRPVCPNCGRQWLEDAVAVECGGDRVLVQKAVFELRRPRRWEVAVFHFPGDPTQAYVKRVVGLPGEAIQIVGGDIAINGRLARKSLGEQRAMRVLVFDSRFQARDADRFPRWVFRVSGSRGDVRSGWSNAGPALEHEGGRAPVSRIDWAEYHHWDPERERYSPVHDFSPYNGGDLRAENTVKDLMIEGRVRLAPDVRTLAVRLDSGSDRFLVMLPGASGERLEVLRDGEPLPLSYPRPDRLRRLRSGRTVLLEASVMDGRLTVALDGELLFDPFDFDDPAGGPGPNESQLAIGIEGGAAHVEGLRVYRDVYYTSLLANTPRRPFGVDAPYSLGAGEYFVLGDNSAVSNDSRFWPTSPVVRSELFLGKPFLVHLPGQVVPLQVFGRSVYWVPDPREIRYIR